MMKKLLKNQKGVTLIALMLTIVILAILAGIAIGNIDMGTDIRNYNYMCADIELLEDKILAYYNENGTIPKGDLVASPELGGQESTRDAGGNYYKIDISKLSNITLNYGGGKTENDVYIVNEKSLEVYYLEGAIYEEIKYYTPFN